MSETVQVRSSAISSLNYDEKSMQLTIVFKKGGTETLRNISRKQFNAFKSAPSAGLYYNQHFRGGS